MYEIYYDEQIIGSLAADELVYFNGSLQQRTNEADTLSFSLTSNNPYLKNLGIRSGVVSLRKNRETVFAGDIVETVEDFYNCVTVTCHGCLTWFKDVQIVHYKKTASASDYLSDILSKYNAACSPQRKINMGYCDISKSVSHDHSDSIRSASYLLNEILEECGGYLVFRYDGQTVYLDWLAEGRDCNQNIDSQNLIDLSKHIDGTNIVTRIYPWGKDGLTMAAPYYVADELLEMYYGIISIDKKYEVETAAELKAKAEAELAQQKAVQSTITLTAVDLSIQNRSLDSFEIAGKVPAISKPHGIEETMVVQEKDLDLNNPANSKVTFGVLAVPLSATAGTSITEATVSGWGFTKNTGTYTKPAGGIPKSDLSEDVGASLAKADTALQQHQSLAAYRTADAQDAIDATKQNKLTAGENVTISEDGKISATGGDGGLGVFEVTLTSADGVLAADKTFEQVKAAVDGGTPVLKVHSDGTLLWFFLLDTGTTEIDFVGFADEQILAYLTAKQDGTWESAITARVTAEMYSALSEKLGNLNNLTTTEKTSLVAAINELKSAAAANVTEATVSGWGFTKNTGTYSKPTGGIPKADLASAVQAALDKADSALQAVPSTYRTASAQDSIDSGKVDKVTGKGLSTNDYTAADKAKVAALAPVATSGSYNDLTDKPTISGAATPLTGTTSEVTPSQVSQAIFAGTPVVVNYTDGTYGALAFTNFNIAENFDIIAAQTIVKNNETYIFAELGGNISTNNWFFNTALLATADIVPEYTSQLTNDSGFLTGHQDISGKVDKVAGKGLSTNDYTAAAKAKVDAIPANPKYTDTVYDDTAVRKRLTAVEGMDNITLSVVSSRLTSLAYTAKYSSLLGIVFVRIYGKVNATMNTGYDYNVLNIGSKSPTANAALAVKCGKNAQAIAQSSGVISVRPFESGIKDYDIYITGFWFV